MTTFSTDPGNNGYFLKQIQLPLPVQKIIDILSKKTTFPVV
jgi:predicted nucleic-acid-binding Zn-ribbon protein